MAEISPLRRRMIEDMTVRNLAPATQRSYVHAVSRFSRYFGHSPDRLGLEDVRAYQVHPVSNGICALRFFYGVTLGLGAIPERIPHAREPRRLPVVLGADEVVAFLEAVSSLKSRAALTTAYAAGLRVSEVIGLKVGDIDSARMVIYVANGKGGKDRFVMLSPQLLGVLRTYWRLARPRSSAVSRSRRGPANRTDRPSRRMPIRSQGRRARQTRQRACFAAQLRDASPGEWRRHPHHPGFARPLGSVDDGALYKRVHSHDLRNAKSVRLVAGADAARLSRGDDHAIRGRRCFPSPRPGLSARACRSIGTR